MPNNNNVFNAALSGAFAGLNNARSLVSSVSSNYDSVVNSSVAFATLLDGEVAPGSFSEPETELLQSLVQQILSGKGDAGTNLVTVDAIITAWNAAKAQLQPVSGGGTRLGHTYYADADTTTPLASQDGNIETPFATLAQAIIAVNADPNPLLCEIIAVGTFPESLVVDSFINMTSVGPNVKFSLSGTLDVQGNVIFNVTNCNFGDVVTLDPATPGLVAQNCNFTGLSIGDAGNNGTADFKDCVISGATTVDLANASFNGCTVAGDVTTRNGDQFWKDTQFTGNADAQNLVANRCVFASLSAVGGCVLNDCHIVVSGTGLAAAVTMSRTIVDGDVTCDSLDASDSTILGALDTGALNASNCTFAAVKIASGSNLQDCDYDSLTADVVCTANLDDWTANSPPPTGTVVSHLQCGPRALLAVNVPALGAAALGSVAVSTVATQLANLPTNSVVKADEPTAGVTGGGALLSTRVNATNSITFKFIGPTAGGIQNFPTVRV